MQTCRNSSADWSFPARPHSLFVNWPADRSSSWCTKDLLLASDNGSERAVRFGANPKPKIGSPKGPDPALVQHDYGLVKPGVRSCDLPHHIVCLEPMLIWLLRCIWLSIALLTATITAAIRQAQSNARFAYSSVNALQRHFNLNFFLKITFIKFSLFSKRY